MAVTYEQWLGTVDSLLAANKRGVSTACLDDDALQTAFSAGLSPVIFAKTPNLPLKPVQPQAVFQPQQPPPLSNPVPPGGGATTLSSSRTRSSIYALLALGVLGLAAFFLYPRGISPSDRARILNFLTDEYGTSKVQRDLSDLVGMGLDYNAVGPAELNLLSSKVKTEQVPTRCSRLAEMATSDLRGELQSGTGKLIYSADRDTIRKNILADIGMSEPEFHQLADQSGITSLVTEQFVAAKELMGQGMTGMANSPDVLKMFGNKNPSGDGRTSQ